LENNKIGVNTSGIKITLQKALPDKFDNFVEMFVNVDSGETKNMELFKRRIIGLTSYFKSAQESLMPKYEKLVDFHVIKIPMSDYQFNIYENYRHEERKVEKPDKKSKGTVDSDGIFKEPSSTYRIFSRLACNFVMPTPPGRPNPSQYRIIEEGKQSEKLFDWMKEKYFKNKDEYDEDIKVKLNQTKALPRNYTRCHQMYQFPVFCADGLIYTCCDNKGNARFALGRWDEKDFRDLWLSARHHEIYNSVNTAFCPHCRPNWHNIEIQRIIDDPALLEQLYT
jgi:hypothetical protein